MQNLLKAIASIVAIGIFGFFAMASFGSTNTTVEVKECKPKPPFTGSLRISVEYRNNDGTGFLGTKGTIFLVHQIIQDTMTCSFSIVSQDEIPFTLDAEGLFQYTTSNFTHNNSGDLWRVETFVPPVKGGVNGFREVDEARYSTTTITIDRRDYPKL